MSIRGAWQLQSLTLRYCLVGGSSSGARSFIQDGSLLAFAESNPQIRIRTRQLGSRHPVVFAEWADGSTKEIDVKNMSSKEVARVVMSARDVASGITRSLSKPVISRVPSIQGVWDPSMTFESFELLSTPMTSQPSAAPNVARRKS